MTVDEEREEGSFAELFENSLKIPQKKFSPGDLVSGVVVKISKDTVFVDLGGKSEGTADRAEFRDSEGNLNLKEGDSVQLRVASVRKGIHLSKSLKVHGAEAVRVLREAQQNQIPVEGRVAAVVKGGFTVEISGTRAFCPLGQIDVRFCERPEEHVGARYSFRVIEVEERGRNIVLSRRALLQEERDKQAQETLVSLREGMDLEARITRITDYGAFADIGGLEGMIHISELSHVRVNHPSEVLKPGQTVKARVKRMEADKKGRPKIALSLKDLELPPWERGLSFKEGDMITGRVSRLADFGAFVEVAPGIDGLLHISELSYERVSHPSRVLKEGEQVQVVILKIDEEKRRISLSLREAVLRQTTPADEKEVRLEPGQVLRGIVEDQKPFGLFVRLPQLGIGVRGLLPLEELLASEKGDVKRKLPRGKELEVEIVSVDEKGKILLSQKIMKEKEEQKEYNQFLQKDGRSPGLGTLGEIFKNLKP